MRCARFWQPSILVLVAACTGGGDSVQGRLQRIVVDPVDRHAPGASSLVEHWLDTDDGQRIRLALTAPEHQALPTGARLRVAGSRRLHETSFAVESLDRLDQVLVTSPLIVDPAMPPPPRKLAVIMFNFQNDDRQPLSVEEARRKIFTEPNSVRAFHKEQSYGFIDLGGARDRVNGDVFGWYTIAANNRPCAEARWDDLALAMAAQQGVDTAGYDHYVFVFPYTDACLYGGRGEQPGKNTWINGGSIKTMNHEMGHNFGTPHAATRICTDAAGQRVSLSASCRNVEYGNPFDVMGHGYRHTNALNKARARWLAGGNIQEIVRSGVYSLLPQERPSGGVQLLSIFASEGSWLYLEYRQPFGYDDFAADSAAVNGIIVMEGGPLRTLAPSYLLDMTPATTTFADAPLGVGQSFTDRSGIRITLVERSAQAAQVRVEFLGSGGVVMGDAGADAVRRDAGAADRASDGASADRAPDLGAGDGLGSGGASGGADAAISPPGSGGSGGSAGAAGEGQGGSAGRPRGTGGATGTLTPPGPPSSSGCSYSSTARESNRPGGLLALGLLAAALAAGRKRRPGRFAAIAVVLMVGLLAGAQGCDKTDAPAPPLASPPSETPRKTGGASGNTGVMTADGGTGTGSAGPGDSPSPDAPVASSDGAQTDGGDAAARTAPGSPGGVTVTVPSAPPPIADACARWAASYCARLDACIPKGVVQYYGDLNFCLARREVTCRNDLQTPGRNETPERRLACAAAIAAEPCRDFNFSRPLAACEYPAGTLPKGAPCSRASQCGAGMSCEIETDELCGLCAPTLPDGGDCSFWGGGCRQGTGCYADQCLAPLPLGAACKQTAANCLGGMACTATGCVEKLGDVGADCARGDICDPQRNLYCNLGTGKCAPLPPPVEIGKPCGVVDDTGAAARCGDGASCFAPGSSPLRRVCVARLPVGSKCDTVAGPLCALPAECTRGLCAIPTIAIGGAPTFRTCP